MPQARVVTGGLVKYLRAGRISDDEIRAALGYLTSVCGMVLGEEEALPPDGVLFGEPDELADLVESIPTMNGATPE